MPTQPGSFVLIVAQNCQTRLFLQISKVHCICTSGGAIEEDIMKTKNPHYVGSFHLSGNSLVCSLSPHLQVLEYACLVVRQRDATEGTEPSGELDCSQQKLL